MAAGFFSHQNRQGQNALKNVPAIDNDQTIRSSGYGTAFSQIPQYHSQRHIPPDRAGNRGSLSRRQYGHHTIARIQAGCAPVRQIDSITFECTAKALAGNARDRPDPSDSNFSAALIRSFLSVISISPAATSTCKQTKISPMVFGGSPPKIFFPLFRRKRFN